MQPVLHSDRLVLRPFAPGDAPALHRFLGDPAETAFWGDAHETLADTEDFVTRTIASDPAKTCDFVITLDDTVIGKAGMWDAPEIGFFLLPGYRSHGYAREALRTVIAHLFEVYALPRITADVDPRNAASLRVLHRLGFVETGRRERTMQVAGLWVDSVDLALTPEAFRDALARA